jgi:hypothetical protein
MTENPTDNVEAANQAAIRSLSDAFKLGVVLGLVGAGSSARVGYPTWSEFLNEMEKVVALAYPHLQADLISLRAESDLLWRAEEYRRLMGKGNFGELIRKTFGRREPPFDAFHEDLMQLPFKHILSTNYDPVIEEAFVKVHGRTLTYIEWTNE